MHLTQPRVPTVADDCDAASGPRFAAPGRFVVPDTEGRLTDDLRGPLQRESSPIGLLAEAARQLLAGDPARGLALADLSVTGRATYGRFRAAPPGDAAVLAEARRRGAAAGAALTAAVGRVVTRAYDVAWALHGYGERAGLGWIAVSAEDDAPYRPVNVTPLRFAQHDLVVNVAATAHTPARDVATRFCVAQAHPPAPAVAGRAAGVAARALPPAHPLAVGPDERVLLFVHGHGSSLDECRELADAAVRRGFTVVAMDLPCRGYAAPLDHAEIAPLGAWDDRSRFPLLEFTERFVVDFVRELEERLGRGFRDQIAAVVGGSLGGNLGLRLGERWPAAHPFLDVVSWSPAGAWDAYLDGPRTHGPRKCHERVAQDEQLPLRRQFFAQNFDEPVQVVVNLVPPPSETWYRDGWPCKPERVAASRFAMQEVYSPRYRQWHWRLALEQLVFSHRTDARYRTVRARTLLMAAECDEFNFANIYSATAGMAALMIDTPGTSVLLRTTGHSIDSERPNQLATEIAAFLPPARPSARLRETWTPWRGLGGILTSAPVAARNEDGRIEVLARGTDEHLWRIAETAPGSGAWHGWAAVAAGLGADHRFGTSLATGIVDGRLHVMAYWAGGRRIGYAAQAAPNGGDWRWDLGSDWGQLIGDAQDAVAVAEEVRDGRRLLAVAALRTNGRMHVRTPAAGNGTDVGEADRQLAGRPELVRNQDGRLTLLARDARGRVLHLEQDARRLWEARWEQVSGEGSVSGDVSAALGVDDRLHLFARGPRGELLHAAQTAANASAFGAWQALGGELVPGTRPLVVRNGWSGLQVFARFQDGSIRHRRQLSEDTWAWGEWESLGGVAVLDPCVVPGANGALVVFHVGRDGGLYWSRQSSARR